MLVAVTGSQGMLGKRVVDECLVVGYTVYKPIAPTSNYERDKMAGSDVIINCAGAIPQKNSSREAMVHSNTYLPHRLAELAVPVLHVSTDCVFSGNLERGKRYTVNHVTDAITDYGRSKALGESRATHVCNVRTSFIGPEHGLMKWLLDQPTGEVISGWHNAMWSGSSVDTVARSLVQMVPSLVEGEYNNIEHLATLTPIRKYDLLVYLAQKYKPTIKVSCDTLVCGINRALDSTIELPSCLI